MHLRMRYMSRGSGINFRKILGHDIMMACSDCVVVQVLITLMYGDYRCDEKLWPPLQIIKLRLFIHEHAQQPRHISMATSFISYLYHRQQFQRELHFGIFGAHKQQHECSESPQAIKFARETFFPLPSFIILTKLLCNLLLESFPDSFTYVYVAFLLLPYVAATAMDKSSFSVHYFLRATIKKNLFSRIVVSIQLDGEIVTNYMEGLKGLSILKNYF